MVYNIVFAKTAKRQFDKLPEIVKNQLNIAINKIANDPYLRGVVKKLSGQNNLYRVRSGNYRAIYQIQNQQLIILVVKVGHRNENYR